MPRAGAGDRLRRLLAIVPWIVAADGPRLEEVTRRFGLTERELLADLDLVFCCGVHPFTPDALMDVAVEDGRVWIRYADYFQRPLRLTPEEGLAIVAAGSAVLAVPGADPHGPLARAIAKIAGVLGVSVGDTVDVRLRQVPETVLADLRAAAAAHRRIEIDYYTYGRDDRARRVVEPHAVFAAEGEWYLTGHCHLADGPRRFRVDRILDLTVLEETFPAPAAVEEPRVFEAAPGDPRVVLRLTPRARWVAEQYPTEAVEELEDGAVRVTLAAGERAWLERLLLQLGPHATVEEGAEGVAAGAAARVLARYGRR